MDPIQIFVNAVATADATLLNDILTPDVVMMTQTYQDNHVIFETATPSFVSALFKKIFVSEGTLIAGEPLIRITTTDVAISMHVYGIINGDKRGCNVLAICTLADDRISRIELMVD